MKLTVKFDWRKLHEPMTQEEDPECVIRDALKKAGYTVNDTFVQGTWDEDKPRIPGGKWDENRLPHQEIAKQISQDPGPKGPGVFFLFLGEGGPKGLKQYIS